MQIQALQIVTKLLGLSCGAVFVTFQMQKEFTFFFFKINIFLKDLYIDLMLFLQTARLKSSIVGTFQARIYNDYMQPHNLRLLL